jgi:arylsulfatase A-like enzyme
MRRWQRVSALLALAALACERPAPRGEIRARLAAQGRPNLVLIVVDTLRADRTTPYGFAQETTPELARWAERGVVFERALAQSSWTKISMASLLTSLWPRSHAIREVRDGLGEQALTLAEALRAAGYRCDAVQTNGWLDASFGFQQGFERYVFPTGAGARLPKPSVWPHVDRVVEEATRLLERRDPAAPFFLYLHFMDVHEYASPPEFRRFGSGTEGAYLAAVAWVDDGIRRVREALEREGVDDETLIVFASDHGESLGEHGRHGHARDLRAPVLAVPLVIRLPFASEPVRVAARVRNLDIAPTLLEAAGVAVPAEFEGESLWALVAGESGAADADARAADRPSFAALGAPLYPDAAIVSSAHDDGWSYARRVAPGPRAGEEQLFDLGVDPGENVDLAQREPDSTQRLRTRLDAHLSEAPRAGARAQDVHIDPSIAERLRAMGYLRGQ